MHNIQIFRTANFNSIITHSISSASTNIQAVVGLLLSTINCLILSAFDNVMNRKNHVYSLLVSRSVLNHCWSLRCYLVSHFAAGMQVYANMCERSVCLAIWSHQHICVQSPSLTPQSLLPRLGRRPSVRPSVCLSVCNRKR